MWRRQPEHVLVKIDIKANINKITNGKVEPRESKSWVLDGEVTSHIVQRPAQKGDYVSGSPANVDEDMVTKILFTALSSLTLPSGTHGPQGTHCCFSGFLLHNQFPCSHMGTFIPIERGLPAELLSPWPRNTHLDMRLHKCPVAHTHNK